MSVLKMGIASFKMGMCRFCNDVARTKRSWICEECNRLNNNARMRIRYEENLKKGLTVNGTERKR